MRPSSRCTTRSACAARAGECVTITTVAPSRCSDAEHVHDVRAVAAVEVARRLVGEDQRRIVDERARDRDALLLAARELVGVLLRARVEPHELEHLAHSSGPAGARHLLIAQRQLDVLVDVEVGDQVKALEDEAHVPAAELGELVHGAARQILVAEYVAAARRSIDEPDDVEHRRLAAAGGSHHRDELAALDREIDAVERRRVRETRIALRHVRKSDHRQTLPAPR